MSYMQDVKASVGEYDFLVGIILSESLQVLCMQNLMECAIVLVGEEIPHLLHIYRRSTNLSDLNTSSIVGDSDSVVHIHSIGHCCRQI